MKWFNFDPGKGSRQKRPEIGKFVLVRLPSRGDGLPESIAVGYRKDASGDKQCPYFVVPGLGGVPLCWSDCLPKDFTFMKRIP